MFIRTQENYREVSKTILQLKKDLRTFLSTLFNTGGMDLPGAREVKFDTYPIDIGVHLSNISRNPPQV